MRKSIIPPKVLDDFKRERGRELEVSLKCIPEKVSPDFLNLHCVDAGGRGYRLECVVVDNKDDKFRGHCIFTPEEGYMTEEELEAGVEVYKKLSTEAKRKFLSEIAKKFGANSMMKIYDSVEL
jgi:hypothetical protein